MSTVIYDEGPFRNWVGVSFPADFFVGSLLAMDNAGNIYTFDLDTLDTGRGPIATGKAAAGDIDAVSTSGTFFICTAGNDLTAWDTGANLLWDKNITGITRACAYVGERVFIGTSINLNKETWIEARDPNNGDLLDSLQLEDGVPGGVFTDMLGLTTLAGSLFALTSIDPGDATRDITLHKINPATLTVLDSLALGNFTTSEERPDKLARGLTYLYVTRRDGTTYPYHAAYTAALVAVPSADFDADIGFREGLAVDDDNNAYLKNDSNLKQIDRRNLFTAAVEDTSAAMAGNLQALTIVDTGGVVAPVIDALGDDAGTVFVPYTRTPSLDVGDPVVVWSFVSAPAGATIVGSSGKVDYTAVVEETVTFDIQATNSEGSDTESWQTTFTNF